MQDAAGHRTAGRTEQDATAGHADAAAHAARHGEPDAATVRAVNTLTARWAGTALRPDAGGVLSSVGLWPLLAFLGGAATGAARAELAAALGVDADRAIDAGRALVDLLDAEDGIAVALGVWARDTVSLREEWLRRLPPTAAGRLTGDAERDRAELDGWAARGTGGLVPRMPLELDPSVLMVLASAFALETTWQQPFTPAFLRPRTGPWRGRDLAGLGRAGEDLDEVRVVEAPCGPLTVLCVRGGNGIDVHLLLGPEDTPPGDVVAAGVRALAGGCREQPGSTLPAGATAPGLEVRLTRSWEPKDELYVVTPAFTVTSDHDLLARPGLFGLESARDVERGHFPGLAEEPLAVGAARQAVTASFSAEGFRAAAVTAVSMAAGGVPSQSSKLVMVDVERPFGFLAVHRRSGLVLTAGWVADPELAAPEDRLPEGWEHDDREPEDWEHDEG